MTLFAVYAVFSVVFFVPALGLVAVGKVAGWGTMQPKDYILPGVIGLFWPVFLVWGFINWIIHLLRK